MSVRAFVAGCLAALVGSVGVSGCAPSPTPARAEVVFNHIQDRNAKVSASYPTSRLEGWLPNRVYTDKNGVSKALSVGVVCGNVVEVKPGRAFSANEDGDEVYLLDDFNASDAQWRTVDVALKVDQSWGVSGDTITFGLPLSTNLDPEEFMDGLRSMDSAIVVLTTQGFFQYDENLYGVGMSGGLLGTTSESGRIRFPALENEAKFLANVNTVDELDAAAKQPVATTKTDR